MICSGCGKDIPFYGEVCPYCHRSKAKDQQEFVNESASTVIAAIFALIAAGIGYGIGDEKGAIIGLVGGIIVGSIIFMTRDEQNSALPKQPSRKPVPKPQLIARPQLRPAVSPPAAPPPPPPPTKGLFIFLSGKVQGPYMPSQLERLLQDGSVSLDTLCCLEGSNDWQPLRNFAS